MSFVSLGGNGLSRAVASLSLPNISSIFPHFSVVFLIFPDTGTFQVLVNTGTFLVLPENRILTFFRACKYYSETHDTGNQKMF